MSAHLPNTRANHSITEQRSHTLLRKLKLILSIVLALALSDLSFAGTFPLNAGYDYASISSFAQKPDENGIRACCPPIWNENFSRFFRLHQLPGKNITDTYGVEFLPDAAMDTQMKAYAPYAGFYAPAGWTANSVLLVAEMKQIPTVPPTSTPNASHFGLSTNIPVPPKHALRGWWTVSGSGIWNGPHNDFGNHPWEKMFMDGIHAQSPTHMQPDKWYMIKLILELASKKDGVPSSWRQDDIACSTNKPRYVAILVRSVALKSASGTPTTKAATIIEVN